MCAPTSFTLLSTGWCGHSLCELNNLFAAFGYADSRFDLEMASQVIDQAIERAQREVDEKLQRHQDEVEGGSWGDWPAGRRARGKRKGEAPPRIPQNDKPSGG